MATVPATAKDRGPATAVVRAQALLVPQAPVQAAEVAGALSCDGSWLDSAVEKAIP